MLQLVLEAIACAIVAWVIGTAGVGALLWWADPTRIRKGEGVRDVRDGGTKQET